jgi:hypothetical protein
VSAKRRLLSPATRLVLRICFCLMVPMTLLIWAESLSMAFTRDWTVAFVPPLPTAGVILMGVILRADRQAREPSRKPDYALIAAMEREVYGETFHHDGAPETGGGFRTEGDVALAPLKIYSGGAGQSIQRVAKNHCRHCEQAHLRWR